VWRRRSTASKMRNTSYTDVRRQRRGGSAQTSVHRGCGCLTRRMKTQGCDLGTSMAWWSEDPQLISDCGKAFVWTGKDGIKVPTLSHACRVIFAGSLNLSNPSRIAQRIAFLQLVHNDCRHGHLSRAKTRVFASDWGSMCWANSWQTNLVETG